MQPNLRYVSVITLTLLSLLGFGMASARPMERSVAEITASICYH